MVLKHLIHVIITGLIQGPVLAPVNGEFRRANEISQSFAGPHTFFAGLRFLSMFFTFRFGRGITLHSPIEIRLSLEKHKNTYNPADNKNM